jgi:hypothetical protein
MRFLAERDIQASKPAHLLDEIQQDEQNQEPAQNIGKSQGKTSGKIQMQNHMPAALSEFQI